MKKILVLVAVSVSLALGACAGTSTSNTFGGSTEPVWAGLVFVSEAALPAEIEYQLIGTIKGEANAGYSGVTTLYPLLAAEARKMGANAVMNAKGGRQIKGFSWAAPYVTGTAVRVADPEALKGLAGSYH